MNSRSRPVAELAPLLAGLLDALEHSSTGVVIVADRGGPDLVRLYTNEPAAILLGYTLDEIYDLPISETVIAAQRPMLMQMIASFRAGQPVPPALELTLQHRNGDHVPSEMAVGRCDLPDGDGVAYIVVLRGVATRPQMQMSMLEADRISLVGALAAGVAHEINNPLTSVLLNLRSLRKQVAQQLGEPTLTHAIRCLDDITIGAERIAGHTRALQTLASRGDTQAIDLAAVVSSALRLAAPTLQPHANVIRQIYPVPPVAGEESRLGQAVLAMMLFSSSGFEDQPPATSNRIVVAVEERDGLVVVEVSDNGRDLTAAESAHAFDPFFRSSSRGAGLGVGLGVARSVATTLGGHVILTARPGGGAIVTMRLPRAIG